MDSLRLTLAVLASLLALVFLGVWFAKGRQHSVKGRGAALFYSVLLFGSALLLIIGARNEKLEVIEKRAEIPVSSKSESETPIQTRTKATLIDSVSSEPKSEDVWIDANSSRDLVSKTIEAKTLPHKTPTPKSGTARELPKSSRPSPVNSGAVEDVIESSVLNAFDVIELFFETYGSPASATHLKSGESPMTGTIEFRQGSAELSRRSLRYLSSLAAQLGNTYQDGQIEIRAQSNERVDSPVHRFLLTQSRAEAVRDVLAAEGFPPSRLIPIGSETEGETRVKFVHRPN